MEEIWRPIVGFEEMYDVSNLGRVRSLFRYLTYKNRFGTFTTRPIKAKFFKCTPCNIGYPRVRLNKDGILTEIHVHRLVASAFIDNPNKFTYVNHLDENKKNNIVTNLEWCTQSRNAIHTYDLHEDRRGEFHFHSKLTEKTVKEIRNYFYNNQITMIDCDQLAIKYNVTRVTIYNAAKKISWRRLLD